MTPREHAVLRLLDLTGQAIRIRDEVADADMVTSLADARAALCLARGVPVEYIDPATGFDYSPRSYRAARATWISHLKSWPGDGDLVMQAFDRWLAKRPDVVAAVEEVDPTWD